MGYVCVACGGTYPFGTTMWRCRCGGLFDLEPGPGHAMIVDRDQWSMWRYRSVLPFEPASQAWRSITLGEGMTPLVNESPGVYFKVEFAMPTLSFKDRGSAVLVAKAAELGVRRLIADSSGNAGTSIAAYATRAGISARVFVPGATSVKKVDQLRAYGATVCQVPGSRADAADAAIEEVNASGDFYASHVYNPLFYEGTKTFAYELWEQLGEMMPGTVVVPAGNGTLLLGAALGFAELVASGHATHGPRLIAVQAANCAPVAAEWNGRTQPSECESTLAEGIAIAEPARLAQMLAAVSGSGGTLLTATEGQIAQSRQMLSRRGLDVEPTAAAAWAAWRDWSGAAESPEPVVVALTGAGLKAPRTT